ncbi:NF-kappa-B inhibitor cactus [Orchesella cincta]|uniref:NF-kappa-B inhibitor cactus n=1 Tax=Orchesella cincta TaxID=48709 RepID=A0A1D2NJZ7_ORCCI|nr:NF-kappa-B inhibitor cactus [Orchesella cincta]
MSYHHHRQAPSTGAATSPSATSMGVVTSSSSSEYDCHPDKGGLMESSTTVDSGFLSSGICTTESDLSVTSACDLGAAVHFPVSTTSSNMPTSPSSSSVNFSSSLSSSSNKSNMMSKSYNRLDSGVDVSDNLSQLNLSESQDPMNVMKSSMMSSGILSEKDEQEHVSGHHSGSSSNISGNPFKSLGEYPPWEYFFTPDEDGDTQLHVAVMQGYTEGVCFLISMVPHPSVLDFQNDLCQTALHVAVLAGQPKLARRLVAAGARVDMRDRNGNTPLHLACTQGDMESLQALTTALAVLETTELQLKYPSFAQALPQQLDLLNYDGQAPIHLAAIGGHCDVIRALHWLGTDLNAKDGKGGRTALHYSVERGHLQAITCLVAECGAKTEMETYGGLTAYQMASESACSNSKEMITELSRLGAIPLTVPMDEDEEDDEDISADEGDEPC